jgi:hypothetical protein
LTNLEDSISNLKQAVEFTEDGHPEKPMLLSNLAVSQMRCHERLGGLADIEDSISNLQQAVQLVEDGYPDKPKFLNNLGLSQQLRFVRLGELVDIQDSISNWKRLFNSARTHTRTNHYIFPPSVSAR